MAISAKMHTGKTTLANRLVTEGQYARISFAAPLKALAAKIGLAPTRENLQTLGQEARKILGADVWVRALWHNALYLPRIVVDDMRYPNEYASLKNSGAILVRLEARTDTRWERYRTSDKFDPSLSFDDWMINQSHSTETALDEGFEWDVVIGTDGLSSDEVWQQLVSHAGYILD